MGRGHQEGAAGHGPRAPGPQAPRGKSGQPSVLRLLSGRGAAWFALGGGRGQTQPVEEASGRLFPGSLPACRRSRTALGFEASLMGNQEPEARVPLFCQSHFCGGIMAPGYLCPDGHFDLGCGHAGSLLSMPGLCLAGLHEGREGVAIWRGRCWLKGGLAAGELFRLKQS